MYIYICAIVLIPALVFAKERGSLCVTPHGETVTCISVLQCPGVLDIILTNDTTYFPYLKQLQCGYDTEPLVCCRFSDYPPGIFDAVFTKPPFTTATATATPPTNVPVNALPGMDCGKDWTTNSILPDGPTEFNEFPWLAALEYKNIFGGNAGIRCSGSIVNKRSILTAAQCMANPEFRLTSVWLGDWNLSTNPDCKESKNKKKCMENVQRFKVVEQIPHPFYSEKTGNNDIGIIILERDIEYNDYIQPICLPPTELPVPTSNTILTVAGWETTESGTLSDIKLKGPVRVLSNTKCYGVHQKRIVSANQLCAIGIKNRGSYRGDSGGPLMTSYKHPTEKLARWYQEGVGSWGVGCEREGEPFIYTRVARYVRWISNTIAEGPSKTRKHSVFSY